MKSKYIIEYVDLRSDYEQHAAPIYVAIIPVSLTATDLCGYAGVLRRAHTNQVMALMCTSVHTNTIGIPEATTMLRINKYDIPRAYAVTTARDRFNLHKNTLIVGCEILDGILERDFQLERVG